MNTCSNLKKSVRTSVCAVCCVYLIIAVIHLAFILFRWHIISLIWEGRLTPPEPDDSFNYIAHIRMIGDTGFCFPDIRYILPWYHADHLRYPLWRTSLAIVKLFGDFSYVDVYKVNFYFGIVLLSFIILYLLKTLERDKLFRIFGFSFLMLFMGSGEYHGFFWIVPSFYSLATTFLLISLVFNEQIVPRLSEKTWCILLFLITFSLMWFHPLGKISYLAVAFSFIIFVTLNKLLGIGGPTKILLRRAAALIACGIVVIASLEVPAYLMGIYTGYMGVAQSQYFSLPGVAEQISSGAGSYDLFQKLYLDFFGNFNSYNAVLLAIGLLSALFSKKTSLFSLYLGFLTISWISCLFTNLGSRFLIYLWPLTFIIYSYGFYFLVRKTIDTCKTGFGKGYKRYKIKFRSKELNICMLRKDSALLILVLALVFSNYIYPFVQKNYNYNMSCAEYWNKRMADWVVDKSIVNYLRNVTDPGDLIVFADTQAFFTITSLGLLDREVAYANWDWDKYYIFLHDKLNGSYLIATSTPKVESVFNLTKAFDRKLSFNFIRSFGILNVYQIVIGQTEANPVFVYKETDADLITDDFQTSFWSITKNVYLVDDNEKKINGENSLKVILRQSERGQNDFIYHQYDTPQDWSSKDLLIFYWRGTGSDKKVEIIIYAPDGQNTFYFTFKDTSTEWIQIVIPFKSFAIGCGNPSWSSVKTIYLRFTLDSPYTETYYIDRVFLDVAPEEKEVDTKLISDDPRTFVQIFLTFFLILFLPGLMWALLMFQIRNLEELMAFSFGLSFPLIFIPTLVLNLLGLIISRISSMLIITIVTAFPLALYCFK